MHVLDDAREADIHVGQPERADDMPEIALSKALVVRLREDLRRQQFVRDLGVRSPFERVVDEVAVRLPGQEPPPAPRGSPAQFFEHVVIAFGIDEDDSRAALDGGQRHQQHQDRLARPRRPHDQGHYRSDAGDRHPDKVTPPGEADSDSLIRDPLAGTQSAPAAPPSDGRHRDLREPAPAPRGRLRLAGRQGAAICRRRP